jgi:hypothetical protein
VIGRINPNPSSHSRFDSNHHVCTLLLANVCNLLLGVYFAILGNLNRVDNSPIFQTLNLTLQPITHASLCNFIMEAVQTFGRKKTATAVAHCKRGKGLIKLNGSPLELIQPQILREKVMEPLLLLGDRFKELDIRIRVSGGGNVSQLYGIYI